MLKDKIGWDVIEPNVVRGNGKRKTRRFKNLIWVVSQNGNRDWLWDNLRKISSNSGMLVVGGNHVDIFYKNLVINELDETSCVIIPPKIILSRYKFGNLNIEFLIVNVVCIRMMDLECTVSQQS
jgi:hypothetical protein